MTRRDEELAAHVRRHGLLQPVVVTPAAGGRSTLVAGHRRLAALRWLAANDTYPARWRDIPAVVLPSPGSRHACVNPRHCTTSSRQPS